MKHSPTPSDLRSRLLGLAARMLRSRTFELDDPADEALRVLAIELRDTADRSVPEYERVMRERFAAEVRVELERLCEEVRDAEPATEGDGRAMNGAIGAYTKALAAVARLAATEVTHGS